MLPIVRSRKSRDSLSGRTSTAMRRRIPTSGGEPLDDPVAVARAPEAQPVVQPVGAAVPELHRLRHHAQATPVRGARHLVGIALRRLVARLFELLARGYGARLGARVRADLRAARSAG